MALIGIGVDVVDVARMRIALARRTGERLRRRVFTPSERADCEASSRTAAERYAARFAAKEAVSKALGRSTRWGFAWPEIEIVRNASGAPEVRLHGRTAKRARSLGARSVLVSLSHERSVAVAHAIAQR
jgi:holo-[acyl-carrier protein] synthase